MLSDEVPFINDTLDAGHISPEQLDDLLADGWRHFGTHFFRYSYGFHKDEIRRVLPLRIRLADFSFTKSQERILKSNAALEVAIRPIEFSSETDALFDRHKLRFDHGIPDSIFDFLSHDPSRVPCQAMEVAVRTAADLLAVSYFDVAHSSLSGIYAMFEPGEARRSLGIFTMLKEIEYAIELGMNYYYLGYAYEGESFYDYKKKFRATEVFDWPDEWKEYDTNATTK